MTDTTPYQGVTQKQGLLNGQRYFLQVIDLTGKNFRVRHFNGNLNSVLDTAIADNAQIAVNGDDYIKGGKFFPTGMSYSNGTLYTPPFESRYWLNVSKTNFISWGYGNPPINVFNLTSFIRPLVVDGKIHPSLKENNIVNTEIHARSILGINKLGQLMILICEGFVNPQTGIAYAGVTLPQATQIMIDNNAVFAGEHGGGGDSSLYSLGKMVNESSDRDSGTAWRGVVQVLEIFIGSGGSTMSDKYTIIGNDGNNHTVRNTYNITGVPLTYSNTSNRVVITNTIGAEAGATVDDVFVYPDDVVDTTIVGGFSAKKNDKWRRVYKVGTTSLLGWTAEIHLGKAQGITVTFVPAVTPPPVPVPPDFPNEVWLSMMENGTRKRYVLAV